MLDCCFWKKNCNLAMMLQKLYTNVDLYKYILCVYVDIMLSIWCIKKTDNIYTTNTQHSCQNVYMLH